MGDLSHLRVKTSDLRWKCETEQCQFKSTKDIDLADMVMGQEAAQQALGFGIQCLARGQNVYVRGPRGTGRMTMVRHLLKELAPPAENKKDCCYVHNFVRPDHPRLVTLAPGTAPDFRRAMVELAEFVEEGLVKALADEPYASKRDRLKKRLQAEAQGIMAPLEEQLKANGLALVTMQNGPVSQTAIFPLHEGQPIPPDQFQALVVQGKVASEAWDAFEAAYPKFEKQMQETSRAVAEIFRVGKDEILAMNDKAARYLLSDITNRIKSRFTTDSVTQFIDEVIDDAVEFRLNLQDGPSGLKELYGVNIVLTQSDSSTRPIVVENTPNMLNMLGTVEQNFAPNEMPTSDFRGIRGGALLAADEGYLVLDVKDLLSEPGAWRSMMRTLRTGRLEIVPAELGMMRPHAVVQPEPIEVNIRVILIGDAGTYYQLDHHDPDFRELFKVLADFDDQIKRDEAGVDQYARVVAGLVKQEKLPHFDGTAVAELTAHGARISARANRLTARFGRIADIAREAAFVARTEGAELVGGAHVLEAIRRTKQRASLPSRRFEDFIESGTILVETKGAVVGQINGLAVMRSGPLTYGFPARITATIGPGSAGLINIEGRAQMSGAIHTKGFHILGGLLRHLLKTDHPLAFSASIAFEQSYGGIDGDSASGAEMVCLLSALTGVPIKQSMSMTGAIDQHGHVEAIGGVNEKIEGFFDACEHFGLTGDQGCVIPKSNAGDLMLRQDVVDACDQGKFHVYAVETIHEALAIMTGHEAGEFVDGDYTKGSMLEKAVEQAHLYWARTLSGPKKLTSVEPAGQGDETQPVPPEEVGRVESE
jgi:ATP-dependent Lon protease